MGDSVSSSKSKMRILLLNPNSSQDMTSRMVRAAESTPVSNSVQVHPMTASCAAPSSIDDSQDIQSSTTVVLSELPPADFARNNWDAILVACFSVHSLVPALSNWFEGPVTGIFEASILTAMSLLGPGEQWGIVTTGRFWEKHLSDGVCEFLGADPRRSTKFAGVATSGLTAGDFHTVSPEEVSAKLSLAAKGLLESGNIACVVLGCGGMAGLEDIIRCAAVHVYGEQRARKLYIVDGVKAGIMQLHQCINGARTFR
ncbi:Asp/Glu/hydantoin racemase [Metarhizium album ARSEF 1941]|uniref:Asp/Glu/hydantoin racemase n=1 Tax=Metarhizium album (strain ARSEF 1941) TaxID=1081103 RepID=A0A0B2WLP7_METAS|nr:Asp/Glu/hydantoin racemase [Metarhizium album ARSEF 1941]KHN94853.1 Asp/Glu/hydantoin racemase [Metarhizium album ARSEF 1941]